MNPLLFVLERGDLLVFCASTHAVRESGERPRALLLPQAIDERAARGSGAARERGKHFYLCATLRSAALASSAGSS